MTPDPDHDHDDALIDGNVRSNNVTRWMLPSFDRLFHRWFSFSTRQTDKANNAKSMHMEGSGHLEISFGEETEVDLHSTENELRIVIESVSGEHGASISAVFDADSARKLGEELVHRSNQIDESN
jgi:hypothetical protein